MVTKIKRKKEYSETICNQMKRRIKKGTRDMKHLKMSIDATKKGIAQDNKSIKNHCK